jgi:hypothetical protein
VVLNDLADAVAGRYASECRHESYLAHIQLTAAEQGIFMLCGRDQRLRVCALSEV